MKKLDSLTIFTSLTCIIILILVIIFNSNILYFLDISSICITLVGSLLAIILTFSFNVTVLNLHYIKLLFVIHTYDNAKLVCDFIQISKQSRKKGTLVLEDYFDKTSYHLLKKGINLVLLKQPTAKIKRIIKTDALETISNYKKAANFFRNWATYSSVFGIIGAIIKAIQMLGNIANSPSIYLELGKCLLAIFYGLLFANLLFSPIANRIEAQISSEETKSKIILEGLLGVKNEVNNRILQEALFSYLTVAERNEYIKISTSKQNCNLKIVA